MASKTIELAKECRRLEESCLYTSTEFFIWLRILRTIRLLLTTSSLIFGAIAGWKTLTHYDDSNLRLTIAVCAFLAGLLPTIAAALKLEQSIEQFRVLSAEFKNLQDRFRQAALVSAKKGFDEFELDVKPLVKRLEEARKASVTPPEIIFRWAQGKVKAGDYSFDVDETGGG